MKNSGSINNKLNRRILSYILLSSIFLSTCSIVAQVYIDYQDNVSRLNQNLSDIKNSYLKPISSSLWDFNEPLVQQQIQGIVSLKNISHVKITTNFGKIYQYGDETTATDKIVEYPITYDESNLGKLVVSANYQDVYKTLWQQTRFKLLSEIIKTFTFIFFSMLIVYWFITRHIYHINRYVQLENVSSPLTLSTRPKKKDELDSLADTINILCLSIRKTNIPEETSLKNSLNPEPAKYKKSE